MAKIEIEVTKINKILIERGLTQTDLYELIKSNGSEIGKDRINRIVNGKLNNYHTNTAKVLANALGVTLDEIVD
jgi:DNA-binding Xre family transcriptional regulator